MLSEEYRARTLLERKLQDLRFYRVIEVVSGIAGRKRTLHPGDVFPSLREVAVVGAGDEEDLEETYQSVRALLSQVAQQNAPTRS